MENEENKKSTGLLETLMAVLLYIKKEIDIPDIEVSVFLNRDADLIINVSLVSLGVINRHYVQHIFTKEMIYNDIDNFELKHFCELCDFEINDMKEKLRRGIRVK